MSNIIFEWNYAGFGEILKSNEMQETLQGYANEIKAKCGAGYDSDVVVMPTRAIASVYAADASAIKDNSENNTLLKALG